MKEPSVPAAAATPEWGNAEVLPGLYIHIPFCKSKCGYCNFYSVTDRSLLAPYLAALRREMDLYRGWASAFDTLYIGGGTPSVLAPEELAGVIADVRAAFAITAEAEVTVEANPGDVTDGLLTSLKAAGVNRLNLGIQSFDDGALALLGRRHSADEALDAIRRARGAGLANIGLDLIYGLPSVATGSRTAPADVRTEPSPDAAAETAARSADPAFAAWLSSLEKAVALAPDHLSCYQLTLEGQTPLAKRCAAGELSLPDDSLQADYFLATAQILEERGYRHYEVSNFARPGRESRHNRKYWDHTPYLGLGPAAHSFSGRERRWNHRDLAAYVAALQAGRAPVAEKESLTPDQLRLEALFLGFRTSRGICLEAFKRRYGEDLLAGREGMVEKLCRVGLLELQDGFLRPTRAGMAVADSLALI